MTKNKTVQPPPVAQTRLVMGITFKRRKKRVIYDKTLWKQIAPSGGLQGLHRPEAAALRAWGAKQGWVMQWQRAKDGTYTVGRSA
jgi:hypothetical protein